MEYPLGFKSGMGNCGIVAIAAATGATYDDVWEWFRVRNNRPGQWRGSTSPRDYMAAFSNFSKNESRKIFEGRVSNKKPGQQRPIPLHYWASIYNRKFPGATFVLSSTNHTMMLKDGILLDNWEIKPVNEHKSRGRRITDAWIIE